MALSMRVLPVGDIPNVSAFAFQNIDFDDLTGDAELSQQQPHLVGITGVGDVSFIAKESSKRSNSSSRSNRL